MANQFIRYTWLSLLFTFAIYLVIPILGPYVKAMGFSNTQVSWLFAVVPLSIIVFMPIIGELADSIGKRRVIFIAIALQILAYLLYVWDTYTACIIIARFLDAISLTTLQLITLAKIEDSIKEKERGEKGGIYLSIGHIGRIAAPLAGGLLADWFFIRFPFIISILILTGLIVLLFTSEEHHFKKAAKGSHNPFSLLPFFLSFKELRLMGLLGIACHATMPALHLFMPLFIIERLGFTSTAVGFALFLYGVTHLLQGVFGKLCDRWSAYLVVILGLTIVGVCFVALYFVSSLPALFVVLFIMGTGGAMWNVSAWTLMSRIGEKQKREGVIVTSYMGIAKIGSLVSFFVSGMIVDAWSFGGLALINGVVLLLAVLYAFIGYKKYYSSTPSPS